ncbi:hypothetical protein [Acinetobacter haemolyticus]|uniref:hypothetical protein n=1 Tax=Acinetobacter haemolyticus TaxID=29430 RepID=UPI00148DD50E|nr:hypothetical protein [Acinetobacter haemolyticus]
MLFKFPDPPLFIAGVFFLVMGIPSTDFVLIAIAIALMVAAFLLIYEFNLNLFKWTK